MISLQVLWFILVAVLFIGFFFLEGFDYGVGMATRFIAKGRDERDQLVETIQPVWDGNEVWLLTAGGAMFAAFPHWYATLFSGYYIPLVVVLLALILRGASFEFRHRMKPGIGRDFWDWALFLGSFLPPFLLGVLFTSLVSGMPIDANMNMYAGLFDYITPYSVVGGVAVTLLCLLHGLNFISLRTLGEVRDRASASAKKLYKWLYAGLVAFAALTLFYTDFFFVRPMAITVILAVIVVVTILTHFLVVKKWETLAFILSGLTLALVVILLFTGLFPRVMVSSMDPAFHMTIFTASSTPYTLGLMTKVTVAILPFVLIYQIWAYYVFRQRVEKKRVAR